MKNEHLREDSGRREVINGNRLSRLNVSTRKDAASGAISQPDGKFLIAWNMRVDKPLTA